MRTLPAGMADVIEAGDFTGDTRAVTRATIQMSTVGLYQNTGQLYASVLFPNAGVGAKELPNVKSVRWERSVENDVASMSMELFNTRPLPPGTGPDTGNSFDLLGYYTFNRGRTSYAQTTWGHDPNDWQDMLVPDRLVRVYQGYGADYDVLPEDDPHLVLTGVWLIDDVTYSADGLISVECRDLGRLLLDHIMFPPVVPLPHYPLSFQQYYQVDNPDSFSAAHWLHPTFDQSSNAANGGSETQFGHHGVDAVDGAALVSYWLSTGYDVPDHPSSFVWYQANCDGRSLSGVNIKVRGGRYRAYLSVYTDTAVGGKITGWNGIMKIPYTPASAAPDNGAGITYSQQGVVEYGGELTWTFPPVLGITKVRITFTSLYKTPHHPKIYRAALRDLRVSDDLGAPVDGGTHTEGNYGDYTEIVKLLLAYGGFYWPENGTQYLTDGNTKTLVYDAPDPYLSAADVGYGETPAPGTPGRIWGDLMMCGTSGPADLGVEIWDKKPLMDGINYVKDILGYFFAVDEVGGAIFRSPNTFKLGNWLSDADDLNATRTLSYITINDFEAILGLRAKLSSRNMREHVFVANVNGQIGAVAKGQIPHPTGLRRVGGWTDQNFETSSECQLMADLITLRQLFTFRVDTVRIPANPAIQCDDQVKIFERTTGDAYFHHVRAISSNWELAEGKWTYDLTTSWLGDSVVGEWAFDRSGLSSVTQAYLASLGQI